MPIDWISAGIKTKSAINGTRRATKRPKCRCNRRPDCRNGRKLGKTHHMEKTEDAEEEEYTMFYMTTKEKEKCRVELKLNGA